MTSKGHDVLTDLAGAAPAGPLKKSFGRLTVWRMRGLADAAMFVKWHDAGRRRRPGFRL